jgi:hypothetical protein
MNSDENLSSYEGEYRESEPTPYPSQTTIRIRKWLNRAINNCRKIGNLENIEKAILLVKGRDHFHQTYKR